MHDVAQTHDTVKSLWDTITLILGNLSGNIKGQSHWCNIIFRHVNSHVAWLFLYLWTTIGMRITPFHSQQVLGLGGLWLYLWYGIRETFLQEIFCSPAINSFPIYSILIEVSCCQLMSLHDLQEYKTHWHWDGCQKYSLHYVM